VTEWMDETIRSYVKDASFADIGGLWGLVNEKLTVAQGLEALLERRPVSLPRARAA
jgi:hypothetical protein